MTRTLSLDANGFNVTGIATDQGHERGPLVVALHGGSYTSAYFDVPGHSLLDAAAANGFDVVALDRPSYGGSDAIPDAELTFARSAEILTSAIAALWKEVGASYDGVVLLGHSIGGAIAMHVAASRPTWPLLGLTISGIHDVAPAHVRQAWDSMPPGQPVNFVVEQRRMFFYGPDWTIDPGIVEAAEISAAPIPLAELLEVVGGWTEVAGGLAAKIDVPVQYHAFEFEQLWTIDAATVQSFASYFTSSTYVSAELLTGTGHDADHHRLGLAFQLRQLAFAAQCSVLAGRPADAA
ncbi:MAG: alpha/beta fold hydrolase [Frankiaceae bacterium]|nr:alpha/beta fold hydrolase [Frankiaceae bacterium]